jgi:uncharacterized alpha/beta hydrolase family protein
MKIMKDMKNRFNYFWFSLRALHGSLNFLLVCSVFVVFFLSFYGCAFIKLGAELKEIEEAYAIRGKIINKSPHQKNVLVVLFERTQGQPFIYQATVLNAASDYYTMEVKKGAYYILAFEDLNNNLIYDKNEPVGYYGNPDVVEISKQTHDAETPRGRIDRDITIEASNRFPTGFPTEIILTPDFLKNSIFKTGEVVSFEDDRFAQSNGSKGYWEPLAFLRQIGSGIFFLEEYDPEKIPILFIHGALGTPLGWKGVVNSINRERFQPWLFYYPSGLSLDKVSNALNILIMDLQRDYKIKNLYVIAQSMGGLVARSFILRNVYSSQQDFIKMFISISTPWNGHRMTAAGVKQAPVAVPSWHDMVPDGPFIESLFQKKIPPYLNYYLMFSYKGDCSLFLKNNDGTVELSSELDHRAQSEAERIFGYNEDHGSIIYSERVLSQINNLLNHK